jgi:uncharacterized protein (TIGR02145 family)
MKIKIILSVLVLAVMASLYGQKTIIDLTFTAINSASNAAYVQLDSIKVMNRTQGGSNVICWPDTILTIGITPGDLLLYIGYSTGFPVGLKEINTNIEEFTLFQNYPNPVKDQSIISMFVPEKGTVNIMLTDLTGRVIITTEMNLDKGYHSFKFGSGNGNLFFLTTRWSGINHSIKILTTGSNSGTGCRFDYIGSNTRETPFKSSAITSGLTMLESGILDAPISNETYTFEFATNIPCPGTPTVVYEGQVYNTIQIFSQCWLKENLNAGSMINGTQDQTNNSIIEKYCYNNAQDSCTKYGGLYQWDEMMQYSALQGVQGICPQGWHLPTDEEWKVLEGAADSYYGIGDEVWDINLDYRGYDAGTNLRTTSGWHGGGNGNDMFGFSGLPGGDRDYRASSYFDDIDWFGGWRSSTKDEYNGAFDRGIYCEDSKVVRFSYVGNNICGVSVRCLRDN